MLLREMVRRGLTLPTTVYDCYRDGPVSFVQQVLGVTPWQRQVQIMQAVADERRVSVRSCHHSGKTWTAASLVHWFTRAYDPSLVLTTAPTDRQVRELLWYEIAIQQQKAGLSGRMTETSLEVSPTQRAFGFSTNTPERFQGWHSPNVLIIVDEASGVPENIYEAIEGCLTGPNAKLLLIGNPNTAAGTFYNAFRSPLYVPFHIAARDVPERLLPASWAEERRLEWGEDSPAYQVRVLGEFPDQSPDSLISMRWVTEAQERGQLQQGEGECTLGADIARFGSDSSVLYVRRGAVVVDADDWRNADTMASAGRIAAKAKQWGCTSVNVDDIGVGGGVVDRLIEEGFPCYGVNVGEVAWDSERFANRRAEIFWGLRDRFRDGDIAIPPDDTKLLAQLTGLRYSYTPRGQIKLESKDDMKKRGLPSPDAADALALCFTAGGGYSLGVAVGSAGGATWG